MLKYEEQTSKIINACMEVHNELGNGFLEAVYQEALEQELKLQEIPYEREKLLPIMYKGKQLEKEYYADFVCYENTDGRPKAVAIYVYPMKESFI